MEHFTYCDMLACEMHIMPTLANAGSFKTWVKIMLTPISTLHYLDEYFDSSEIDRQKVYMPPVLVAFLSVLRALGWPFRMIQDMAILSTRKA